MGYFVFLTKNCCDLKKICKFENSMNKLIGTELGYL